jgi:hypothetical protein
VASREPNMRIYFIMIAAALVAGCASRHAAPTAVAPGVNLSGYSQAFRVGYADGCGSVDAARKRDEPRFKTDADYAQGWRDGYSICKRR